MTSINSSAINVFYAQRNFMVKNRLIRKSLFDLRGVDRPAIGKKANLAEIYGSLITDYVFYCEACIKHDLEFQGKKAEIDSNLKQNPEIKLSDHVDDDTTKIIQLWILAQDMLTKSFMRENILKINKWNSYPKTEIDEFLGTSENHRIFLVSAFYDAFFVSYAYLVKKMELNVETEADVEKWASRLESTYRKVIEEARRVAQELGMVARAPEELWELFEINTLLKSGLRIFL